MAKVEQNDIDNVKAALELYARMKLYVQELEEHSSKTALEGNQNYHRFSRITQAIEQAISELKNSSIKQIMEYRYIKGIPHKVAAYHFSHCHSVSTFDRKVRRGIRIIATDLGSVLKEEAINASSLH